jgi:CheY-like chemotaxis protein
MDDKILIVDDSHFFRGQLRLALGREYDVIEACNGADGLALIRREKPDLVLLDVALPDCSGFEICRILRKENNMMPIIMISSQDAGEDILVGLELGADDYVKKPFNERELLCRVRNVLRRVDRGRGVGPLTGLSGQPEMRRGIAERIERGALFAVIYVDIDNFKSYNDAYGFAEGDRVITWMANMLKDRLATSRGDGDFVGHLGGDDFVIVTGHERARRICEEIAMDFDEEILGFYNDGDRRRGCVTVQNRKGGIDIFPLMSVSMAVITNERRSIGSFFEVGDIAAELRQKLKTMPGSNFFFDRRTDPQRLNPEATELVRAPGSGAGGVSDGSDGVHRCATGRVGEASGGIHGATGCGLGVPRGATGGGSGVPRGAANGAPGGFASLAYAPADAW